MMRTRSSRGERADPSSEEDRHLAASTADWGVLARLAGKYGVVMPAGRRSDSSKESLRARLEHHIVHRLPRPATDVPQPRTAAAAEAAGAAGGGAAASPPPSAPLATADGSTTPPSPSVALAGLLGRVREGEERRVEAEEARDVAVVAQQEAERELRGVEAALAACMAECGALRAQLASSQSQLVRVQIYVADERTSGAIPQPEERPTPPPLASPPTPEGRALTAAIPTPPVVRRAAAPASPTSSHPRREAPAKRRGEAAHVGGEREWVVQGFDWPAGSAVDAVEGDVRAFASTQLGMRSCCMSLTVGRVSSRRPGLAIVRLADVETERVLRSAKRLLDPTCPISIFRSRPPKEREAAAASRRAPQSSNAGKKARRAAREALAFAQSFHRRQGRPPSQSALIPRPPLGSPSRFAVLDVEEPTIMPSPLSPSAPVWVPAQCGDTCRASPLRRASY